MEIIETKFKEGRFYITIKYPDGKQATMPRANMVWLEGNPSFKSIPKGYVIHHLDYDKSNDDISNLSLMYKFHHVAHHWKQKKIHSKIDLNEKEIPEDLSMYSPTKRPYYNYHAPAKRYYVGFYEKNECGKSVEKRVWRFNGKPILTKDAAETLSNQIWELKLTI